MSDTLRRIINLVQAGDVLISAHGYDEMAEDSILADEVIAGIAAAILVEDYPDYSKGPCSLVLERDRNGDPASYAPVRVSIERESDSEEPKWH